MSEGDELGQAPKGYKYKRTRCDRQYLRGWVRVVTLEPLLVIRNISAEDLQDVRRMFRMKVYALISISGDPFIPAGKWNSTTVDYEGGTDPTWKTQFSFTLHDPSLHRNLQRLNFQFYCERSLGDKIVGEFSTPVKSLFDKVGNHNVSSSGCYPVTSSSGGEQGAVKFTFEFGQPLARVVTPPRSQLPPRPQVHVQPTVDVQLNLNISGIVRRRGYTAACDDDNELACDDDELACDDCCDEEDDYDDF
ncbi:hypothetical protein AAG906_034794 [Vitis piasezkii]